MEQPIVTSIRVPRRIWLALRLLAERRAVDLGRGKASVSHVIADMVEAETARQAEGRCDA